MAKTTKWLNVILDYMKKVKSNVSTVHTHPPEEVFIIGGANQRLTSNGGRNCLCRHIATWLVGGWAVQAVII